MKSKNFRQWVFHLFSYIVICQFSFIIKLLPYFTYKYISKILGSFMFFTVKGNKNKVIKNLEIAFGDKKTAEERRNICRTLFVETIMNFLEMIYFTKSTEKKLQKLVEVEGEENLKEAMKQKMGVVAACSHMGNFPIMQTKLVKMGYPVNSIARDANNVYLAKFGHNIRKKVNMPDISKWNIKKAIKESQAWLKNNGILCIYLDQHAGNGVKVKFFDRDVLVPVGAAVFARKYKCPVIGIFSYRKKSGKHKVIIEGPYKLQRTSNSKQDIQKNTSIFMERVEYYTKQYPEQWFSWMHRRFR